VTTYFLFLSGVIAYVLFDWARWKVPGVAWSGYWGTHAGPNIANAIMALMAFLAWQGKILGELLALVGFNADSKLLTVEVGPVIAPVAGFVLSIITMAASRKLWPKGE
jgi:hypothetical protein